MDVGERKWVSANPEEEGWGGGGNHLAAPWVYHKADQAEPDLDKLYKKTHQGHRE